jgi:hypothetical protein
MTSWSSRSLLTCLFLLAACPGDPAPLPADGSSTGAGESTSTGPGPGTTPQPTTVDSTGSDTTADTTGPGTGTSTGPDDTTGGSSSTGPDDTTGGSSSSGDPSTSGSSSGDPSTTSGSSSGDPTTGGDPCDAGDGPDFAVTNNGAVDYVINGVNDPPLTVVRGCSYTFNINAVGHPFLIKTVQGSGAANSYNDGVVGNGAQNGAITWDVSMAAPDSLFYNCQFHGGMTGTIMVIDPM